MCVASLSTKGLTASGSPNFFLRRIKVISDRHLSRAKLFVGTTLVPHALVRKQAPAYSRSFRILQGSPRRQIKSEKSRHIKASNPPSTVHPQSVPGTCPRTGPFSKSNLRSPTHGAYNILRSLQPTISNTNSHPVKCFSDCFTISRKGLEFLNSIDAWIKVMQLLAATEKIKIAPPIMSPSCPLNLCPCMPQSSFKLLVLLNWLDGLEDEDSTRSSVAGRAAIYLA